MTQPSGSNHQATVVVSVIVAVKNGAETLQQCIASALAQTGVFTEVIVVDAMSQDDTQDIVNSFGGQIAVYVREPDEGIYDAWNKALGVATGDWCIFLGSDDYFLNADSLAELVRTATSPGPVPVFVHGGVLRVGGAVDYVAHPNPSDVVSFLRSGQMLPHQGTLHHLASLREVGAFDASYRIVGDFVALLRLAGRGQVRRCPEVVTAMRIGGISNHWPTMRLAAREKFRAMRTAVGLTAAIRRHMTSRWPQVVGRAVEQTTLTVLGSTRGTRLLVGLRRNIGRPPKLI